MMGSLLCGVLPFVLFAQTPVLVESFSHPAFPPPGWDTTRSDTAMGYWIRYATSGANPDSHHARVQTHKAADTLRQGFSELTTVDFDLSASVGLESLTFWFRFSAGSQSLGPDDTVSTAIREDSAAWCALWKLGSGGQSNDWQTARISLASFDGFHAARLRFRFDDRPNNGLGSTNRYFWLDSIKVVSYPAGIADHPGEPLTGGRRGRLAVYPNPARRRVEYKFTPGKGHRAECIELNIYDASGSLVKCFFYYALSPNPSALRWDCTDRSGHVVPAGVYFCEAVVNGMKERQTLVLIR